MIGCSMGPGTGSYNLATRTVQCSMAQRLNRLWAGLSVVDTMWKITASLPTDNRLTYAADGWGDAGLRSWPPERADMVRMPRHYSRPSESGGRRDVESGAALQSERQGKDGDSQNRVHLSVLHECEVWRIKRCREVLLLVGGKLKNGFGCEQEGVRSFKFRSLLLVALVLFPACCTSGTTHTCCARPDPLRRSSLLIEPIAFN